jgi:glyoxylase-like metal-dependent hydrolase (beta-lactamase superfamily II)
MFTRFVQDGLEAGEIAPSSFYHLADEALIEDLADNARLIPSGQLILSLRDRALYKRGITLYPAHGAPFDEFAIADEQLDRVKELYWRPDRRREKEIAVCDLLNRLEGLSLEGFEVLLDIPRVVTVFDVDDFRDLRVLVDEPGRERRFVTFESYGFTQLTADFVQEFERFSRRVQVVCRPDLREAVIRRAREIRDIVIG